VSSGNRRESGRFFPAEVRADIGAFPVASLAGEERVYIGYSHRFSQVCSQPLAPSSRFARALDEVAKAIISFDFTQAIGRSVSPLGLNQSLSVEKLKLGCRQFKWPPMWPDEKACLERLSENQLSY
jgi:hypothetical protein